MLAIALLSLGRSEAKDTPPDEQSSWTEKQLFRAVPDSAGTTWEIVTDKNSHGVRACPDSVDGLRVADTTGTCRTLVYHDSSMAWGPRLADIWPHSTWGRQAASLYLKGSGGARDTFVVSGVRFDQSSAILGTIDSASVKASAIGATHMDSTETFILNGIASRSIELRQTAAGAKSISAPNGTVNAAGKVISIDGGGAGDAVSIEDWLGRGLYYERGTSGSSASGVVIDMSGESSTGGPVAGILMNYGGDGDVSGIVVARATGAREAGTTGISSIVTSGASDSACTSYAGYFDNSAADDTLSRQVGIYAKADTARTNRALLVVGDADISDSLYVGFLMGGNAEADTILVGRAYADSIGADSVGAITINADTLRADWGRIGKVYADSVTASAINVTTLRATTIIGSAIAADSSTVENGSLSILDIYINGAPEDGLVITGTGSGGAAWEAPNAGTVTEIIPEEGIAVVDEHGPGVTIRLDATWVDSVFVNEGQAASIDSVMLAAASVPLSKLKASNAGSDGQFLSKDGGKATWATPTTGVLDSTVVGAIGSTYIKDGQVKGADIQSLTITKGKLAATAVDSTKVADGTMSVSDLLITGSGNVLKRTSTTKFVWGVDSSSVGGGSGDLTGIRSGPSNYGIIMAADSTGPVPTIQADTTFLATKTYSRTVFDDSIDSSDVKNRSISVTDIYGSLGYEGYPLVIGATGPTWGEIDISAIQAGTVGYVAKSGASGGGTWSNTLALGTITASTALTCNGAFTAGDARGDSLDPKGTFSAADASHHTFANEGGTGVTTMLAPRNALTNTYTMGNYIAACPLDSLRVTGPTRLNGTARVGDAAGDSLTFAGTVAAGAGATTTTGISFAEVGVTGYTTTISGPKGNTGNATFVLPLNNHTNGSFLSAVFNGGTQWTTNVSPLSLGCSGAFTANGTCALGDARADSLYPKGTSSAADASHQTFANEGGTGVTTLLPPRITANITSGMPSFGTVVTTARTGGSGKGVYVAGMSISAVTTTTTGGFCFATKVRKSTDTRAVTVSCRCVADSVVVYSSAAADTVNYQFWDSN